jgi:hypothetical protein
LHKIYAKLCHPKLLWLQLERFKGMLGQRVADGMERVAVITTNYDVVAECLVTAMHKRSVVGFRPQSVGGGERRQVELMYGDEGVPLYKLHGSVNWFMRQGVEDSCVVDERYYKTDQQHLFPICCAPDFVPPGDVVIVPPTYSKGSVSGPAQKIWAGAAQELAHARVVVFVGYSFPGSDTEMRFFLGRSFSDNETLRRIVIVDMRASAIAARIAADGSGYGDHFGSLLVPVDGEWQTVANSIAVSRELAG